MTSSSKLKSIDFDRRTPEVLWAQRSNKVYLTVALPDANDVSVNCEPHGSFKFSATGGYGEKYDCTLELYGPIVPESKNSCETWCVEDRTESTREFQLKGQLLKSVIHESGQEVKNMAVYVKEGCKFKIGLRNILCSIKKEQKGWWKRLLKSEGKPAPYLKVDWSKWCDDDESDYDSASEDENTCNDDEESDDDGLLYLPDLEKARKKMN